MLSNKIITLTLTLTLVVSDPKGISFGFETRSNQFLDDYLDLRLSAANIPRTGLEYMQICRIQSINMHISYSERLLSKY